MRNLIEYPITKQELINYLDDRYFVEVFKNINNCGSIEPSIVKKIIEIVEHAYRD